MTKEDYYVTLGVEKNASSAEIKKAYRKLAMQHHPDRTNGDDTKFKEIKEAYETLSDDNKRALYDQYGHNQPNQNSGGFGGFGFNHADVFSTFFGQGHNQQEQQVMVSITLEESFTGCSKPISFTKDVQCNTCNGTGSKTPESIKICPTCQGHGHMMHGPMIITCPTCHGKGKTVTDPCNTCHGIGTTKQQVNTNIKIPNGIPHGTIMRGDGVIIVVNIQPHSVYTRHNLDLHMNITVDAIDAILGTSAIVTTLTGEQLKLNIAAGTQHDSLLKLSNKGITYNNNTGHILCRIKIKIPTNLNDNQIELLNQFKIE